jgi:Holliday junction resolvase-like predicted endonuclease
MGLPRASGKSSQHTWSWGAGEKKRPIFICAATAMWWSHAAGIEEDVLCFVEVKTRTSRSFATAESAVDDDKTQTLRRMARQYLHMMPIAPEHVRFDVLSIYFEVDKPADYQLFRGAFDWR